MNIDTAFSAFMVIGIIFVAAAAGTLCFLLYRYIKDMRRQGFFGGSKNNEEE